MFRGGGGSGSQGSSWNQQPQTMPQFTTPAAPLPPAPLKSGTMLNSLRSNEIVPPETNNFNIRDVGCVASYNWLGSVDEPTMAIPGAPPKWSPPTYHPQLEQDSGTYYSDTNAAHSPKYPLYPAALALFSNNGFSTAKVELMACSTTLRNLWAFACGEPKAFRIMVEKIGNTVFLIRRDGPPREVIANVKGYGHTMPEAYTAWHRDLQKSVSNQRIVQYTFADMNCCVRYEPDGYLPDKLPTNSEKASVESSATSKNDLTSLETRGPDAVPGGTPIPTNIAPFKIARAGAAIPQDAILELKTRNADWQSDGSLRKFAPKLWLSQTPYFLLGVHSKGRIQDVCVLDVKEKLAQWEVENVKNFNIIKFAGLLEWITKQVSAQTSGLMEIRRQNNGVLEAHRAGADYIGALPSVMKERWLHGATSAA